MEKRQWFKGLATDARIAVSTKGRPPERYVVRLEVLVDESWMTIHLFDNVHGCNDEHSYIGDAKQTAREFFTGPAVQALPAAIGLLDQEWPTIMSRWKERRG